MSARTLGGPGIAQDVLDRFVARLFELVDGAADETGAIARLTRLAVALVEHVPASVDLEQLVTSASHDDC